MFSLRLIKSIESLNVPSAKRRRELTLVHWAVVGWYTEATDLMLYMPYSHSLFCVNFFFIVNQAIQSHPFQTGVRMMLCRNN